MLETIKKLVLETAQLLTETKLKVSTAESCTGGGLSYWLTSVPGSGDWFGYGFVTYSDESKTAILGVDKKIIDQTTAVSEETALAMAKGAAERSKADFNIAITGLAGPDGGTDGKPVGTVYIGWTDKKSTSAKRYQFEGDRQSIRLQAMAAALEIIISFLKSRKEL